MMIFMPPAALPGAKLLKKFDQNFCFSALASFILVKKGSRPCLRPAPHVVGLFFDFDGAGFAD